MKRVMDVVLAGCALLVLCLPLSALAWLVRTRLGKVIPLKNRNCLSSKVTLRVVQQNKPVIKTSKRSCRFVGKF